MEGTEYTPLEIKTPASDASVNFQVYAGAENTTPIYLRQFLTENTSTLATALANKDRAGLASLLRGLARVLPTDTSFREIASFVARRQNGNLLATTVEGNIDIIDAHTASLLLDDLVEGLPSDTEQLFFLHTHPATQSPIGPIPASEVGFSQADINFMKHMGGKLRIYQDLSDVYVGLSTANTRQVVMGEGENEGLAYGWSFDAAAMNQE